MPDTISSTEQASGSNPAAAKKRRSRVFEYLIVLVVIGVVVTAAFFQEQIGLFFGMRLWDRGAPGRVVTDFLNAGKKGDQKAASDLLGGQYKPLTKEGKWLGFLVVSQGGTMEFPMDELAPAGGPKITNTEYLLVGKGAATVTALDSKNEPVKYRVEMQDSGWKITEILGGRPAPQAPAILRRPGSRSFNAPGAGGTKRGSP